MLIKKGSLALSVVLLIVLSGCEKVEYVRAVPVSGYLHTPWGKYEFKNISEEQAKQMRLYLHDYLHDSYLMADAADVRVIYSVLGHLSSLVIVGTDKFNDNFHFKLDSDSTYLSDEKNTYIAVQRSIDRKRGNKSFKTLQKISYGGIYTRALGLTEYDTAHSIYIPFTFSDQDFLVDIKVKKERIYRTEIKVGVPATP